MTESAIGYLNRSPQSYEVGVITNVPPIHSNSSMPTNDVQPNHLLPITVQHTSANAERDNHLQKQMANISNVSVMAVDRKYDVSSQFSPILKKRRRQEEPIFYRASAMEKRPTFENVTTEHALVHDSYPNFDCNLSTWSAAPIASNVTVGKWWT